MALIKTVAVAPVWAGHPVGFDLLTHGDGQFIAFYDAERKMTVGLARARRGRIPIRPSGGRVAGGARTPVDRNRLGQPQQRHHSR